MGMGMGVHHLDNLVKKENVKTAMIQREQEVITIRAEKNLAN